MAEIPLDAGRALMVLLMAGLLAFGAAVWGYVRGYMAAVRERDGDNRKEGNTQ